MVVRTYRIFASAVGVGLLTACSAPNSSSCPVGTTACPAGCVNLNTDPNNCGACGALCPTGTCAAGACQAETSGCPSGTVDCGELGCVAPENCSAVGSGCAAGEQDCGNGCVAVVSCLPASGECPQGTLNCDGTGCIDPMTSKAHCGKCNFPCNGDLMCADGACLMPCQEPLLPCGGACTDVSSHVVHCGACNNTCAPLSECWQSQCVGGPGPRQLNGYFPTTVTVRDAFAAFEQWRTLHVEDCGGDVLRVKFDAPNDNQTVSEGIGYGMLLAAGWADRLLFDGLMRYYQAVLKSNGLMPWKLDGCSRTVVDDGAASDGDLDIAMALLMAECMWPDSGYGTLAFNAINALHTNVVEVDGSRLLLIAGDRWASNACANPSYFAPGYYRAFAVAGAANAADWTKLADDSYYYLEKAANPTTGLVSEWVKGDNLACNYSPGEYGYNAARTPWRVVTDYAWWGAVSAQAFATRLSNWVASIGITSVVDGYTLAGAPTGQWKNSTFVGGFALTAIPSNQEASDKFHADWLSYVPQAQDSTYFNSSLRALYLLLSAGRLVPGCY